MDNRGWGLNEMLGFVAVIGFSLVIVAILCGRNFSNMKTDHVDSVEDTFNSSESSDNTVQIESPNTNTEIQSDYRVLENNVANATIRYIKERNQSIIGSTTYISLDQLKATEHLSEYQNDLSPCVGYVEYHTQDSTATTYLSCGSTYQTSGYQTRYAS